MARVSVSEMRDYLKITCSDYDDLLESLIDSAQAQVEGIIGDIEKKQHTEQVSLCDILFDDGSFYVDKPMVESLDKLDAKTYIGVYGEDYIITKPKNRKLIVSDIADYLTDLHFEFVNVTYTAGYDQIPEDVKLAIKLIVAGEYAKESGKQTSSYRVGDVSMNFETSSDGNSSQYLTVKSKLAKYERLSV